PRMPSLVISLPTVRGIEHLTLVTAAHVGDQRQFEAAVDHVPVHRARERHRHTLHVNKAGVVVAILARFRLHRDFDDEPATHRMAFYGCRLDDPGVELLDQHLLQPRCELLARQDVGDLSLGIDLYYHGHDLGLELDE